MISKCFNPQEFAGGCCSGGEAENHTAKRKWQGDKDCQRNGDGRSCSLNRPPCLMVCSMASATESKGMSFMFW